MVARCGAAVVRKEHAFAGLVALARAAPEGGVGGLAPMMHAIIG